MSTETNRTNARVEAVRARMHAACERSKRNASDVTLVAVSKYASLDETIGVLDAGCKVLGEARWPDYSDKLMRIGTRAEWHYIGHLQTNKVKHMIDSFSVLHSLDRMSLAKEVSRQAQLLGLVMDVFIQVNVSGEASKHGLHPDEVESFLRDVLLMPGIRPIGWMTMAPYETQPEDTRIQFRRLRELRDRIIASVPGAAGVTALSMGMSNDFEVAIEEGATHVRVGSLLFEDE